MWKKNSKEQRRGSTNSHQIYFCNALVHKFESRITRIEKKKKASEPSDLLLQGSYASSREQNI
jgi:hypothetical protein